MVGKNVKLLQKDKMSVYWKRKMCRNEELMKPRGNVLCEAFCWRTHSCPLPSTLNLLFMLRALPQTRCVFHKDTCYCEFCGDFVFACIWPQIWKSWLTCCFPLWSISAGLKSFFSAFLHMHHICNFVVLLMCLLLTVCVIVCPPSGESGLGKSTLINSLFLTDLYSKDYPGPSQRIKKTVQVRLILDQ